MAALLVNSYPAFDARLRLFALLALLALAALVGAGPAWSQPLQSPVSSPALTLRFTDFFRSPVGPRGIEISPTLRGASGREVALTGFMVKQEVPTPGRFMLTPRPVQMSEYADGDADDLPPATVMVYLDPGQQDWEIAHVRGPVSVSGVLAVGRQEAPGGRITWVQMQLSPAATRPMNAYEMASYLHNLWLHRH